VAHVTWEKPGEADVEALDGDRIRLVSTRSAAPGTPLAGRLADGAAIRVKVHRCRLLPTPEGEAPRYAIEGRLLDVPRELRGDLARLAASGGAGADSGSGEPPEP
jgi:hypothetical protein